MVLRAQAGTNTMRQVLPYTDRFAFQPCVSPDGTFVCVSEQASCSVRFYDARSGQLELSQPLPEEMRHRNEKPGAMAWIPCGSMVLMMGSLRAAGSCMWHDFFCPVQLGQPGGHVAGRSHAEG